MKKVLLAGTAIAGVALMASPAKADLKLDLGGYFRGYAVYTDNDEIGGTGSYENLRTFEFKKDAEVHFTGETTTDMGLTVGVHAEMKLLGDCQQPYGGSWGCGNFRPGQGPSYNGYANGGAPSSLDESYIYFSGGWGRVNFGSEDGAAYLLQVAAPSADSNVDGLRPTIQGFTSDVWNDGSVDQDWYDPVQNYTSYYYYWLDNTALGYDNANFRNTDKITYLTPKWNGFQAGVSWAPVQGQLGVGNGTNGMGYDDLNDTPMFENIWDAAVRWDGEFQGFGISVGGGYSTASTANESTTSTSFYSDDLTSWDAGLNLTWQGWSLGAAYLHNNTATDTNGDVRVWDVGLGWDNGPWHLGASWWNGKYEINAYGGAWSLGDDLEIDRYTVGGGYTYGPGMSFRGAVAWMNVDTGTVAEDTDPIQVTLGTDVNF